MMMVASATRLFYMKRSEKTFVVDNLAAAIRDAKSVSVIDYQGLSTPELETLRQAIRQAGGKMTVVKNTLLARALGKMAPTLAQGPTAVVLAEDDEVAPLQKVAKVIAEKEKPKLKFGIFYGEILDTEKLTALSKLPSKNVLLGRLLGSLAGPMYGLVTTLNSNLEMLVYILRRFTPNQGR